MFVRKCAALPKRWWYRLKMVRIDRPLKNAEKATVCFLEIIENVEKIWIRDRRLTDCCYSTYGGGRLSEAIVG